MANDDNNVIDLATRAKQMQNLRPYKNKTLDEIMGILEQRQNESKVPSESKPKKPVDAYDERFNKKFNTLKNEFSLDMNDSNDVEALKTLVRYQIQHENVTRDIDNIQKKENLTRDDYQSLKTLGEFQTGVSRSMIDLQDKLGISRKQRKEKNQDDVPKFIGDLLARGKKAFDEKTTKIECPRCMIELGRIWFNFPNLDNEIQASLQCWKCSEKVEYAK